MGALVSWDTIINHTIELILFYLQGESILADSGTEQLELIALSQRTGDPKYQQKVFPILALH